MARSTAGAERRSTSAERQIQVRQVTHVQASWTEQDRGEAGAFTLQLILDNGAAEYVLRPTAEDADVLVKLFARSANATFDVDREVPHVRQPRGEVEARFRARSPSRRRGRYGHRAGGIEVLPP